ncbi:putative ABC transporter permease [Candidatus Saccharibacteria bacterium]|nr:putative ABC transporter permease [Candidatus Saccharibacteria bacterium]
MKKGGKKSLRRVYRKYLSDRLRLEKWQWVGLLMVRVVFAGFVGWVSEYIFYYFDAGTGDFYMQGGNFLPWINIYAIGAVLIIVSCWKIRRYPWAVFLLSVVVTGALEFIGGWLVYVIGNGTRYWDYNVEILNFGNIGGFVCLRSVLIFGFSALFLMYVVVPFIIWLSNKMSKRAFLALAITLFTLVMVDEVYNILASKFFGWPDAMEFYRNMGWRYLS